MTAARVPAWCGVLAFGLLAFSQPGLTDTTDVKWRDTVTVEKQGNHCVDDANCFNRYHPEIPTCLLYTSPSPRDS